MPFSELDAVSRGDLLASGRLMSLRSNDDFLRSMFGAEHDPTTGQHNCVGVPRVFARIVGTTVTPSTSRITSVTNPTAGKMSVFLQSGQFTTSMRPVVCLNDHNSKPHLARCDVVSDTQVDIYGSSLSSALGAGNSWTTFDMTKGLSLAIYDDPVATGDFGSPRPSDVEFSSFLSDAHWNPFPPSSAELEALASVCHSTSDGAHTSHDVSKAHAIVRWGGSSYATFAANGVSSLTRLFAGVVVVGLSPSLTASHGRIVIPEPGPGRIATAHCWSSVSSSAVVTLYEYNRTTKVWAAADLDFTALVHG